MTKSLEMQQLSNCQLADIGVFLLQCAGAVDDGLILTVQDVGSLARLLEEYTVEVCGGDDPRGKYWDGLHGDLATDELREYMERELCDIEEPDDSTDDIDCAVDTLNATADALEAALAKATAEQESR